jgi:hypothetical protein
MSEGPPVRPARDELADATVIGNLYLRRLIRTQLALSVLALVTFGALLGGLPLALLLLPGVAQAQLLGLPLPLLLVGVPMFPFMIALAWLYQHRADALDAAFADLVAPPPPEDG